MRFKPVCGHKFGLARFAMIRFLVIGFAVLLSGCGFFKEPGEPPQEPLVKQIDEGEKKWREQKIESYRIEVQAVRGTWHAQSHRITLRNDKVVDELASCIPAPAELGKCEVEPFNAEDYIFIRPIVI